GPDSVATAAVQQALGDCYLHERKDTQAEQVLRACLATVEKTQPDAWETFQTRSLLGGALLGQKKYEEAEPLLLGGYAGMKEREARIPMPERPRLAEAAERLAKLYESQGKKEQAEEWRRKEKEARTAALKPAK